MVVTPLMWRSLDRFNHLFGFMVTNPIEYDAKKRRFQFNQVSIKMWPYICSIAILFLSVFLPCMVLGIFRFLDLIQISLTNVMVLLIALLVSGGCLMVELITVIMGYKLVGLVNCVIETEKKLKNPTPGSTDVLGATLIAVVTILGFYPYVTFVFVHYSQLDPLFQFQQLITHYWPSPDNFPISKFVMMTILRPLLALISMFQACRFIAILFCGGAVASISLLDSITHMERISNRFWVRSYAWEILHNHAIIQILLQWSSDVLHSLVAIFQFGGFVSVPLNYMALKMYSAMPFRIYLALTVVCILLPLSHQVLLPILISVYEGEVNLHRKWRRSLCFCGDTRYLVRRIKATRILRVYCSILSYNFYFLKKSTKLRYQYTILSYTISALLSGNE
ncbi:hypothetical protein Fcan01_25704 [Folsomia candida]|uniref:Uncharacterized protein n=1 Tax=Folsomia candida TaxID=158441 RepID=A0A226D415_FOLCA|nr:hypothetical protein Fcan01_25704 [Folsomia candida]